MGKQEQMTAAEYSKLRGELADRDNQGQTAKYKNVRRVVDGIKFQSTKEANFYGQCKMLKLAGKIVDFKMQEPFHLVVNGEHIAKYIADFVLYYSGGWMEVIDIKSEATRVIETYRIKKKLMRAIHNITIIEK